MNCPACNCCTYRIWHEGKLMERCSLNCGYEKEIQDQRKEQKIIVYETRRKNESHT